MTAEPLTYTTRADFAGLVVDDIDTEPHPALDFHGGLVMGCTVHRPEVWILSGVAMGEVRVHVERLDRPPSAPGAEWEDVVEVSCRPRAEHVFARGPQEFAPGPAFALNPSPDTARPLGVSAGPSHLTPEEQARAEENLLRRGRKPSSGT